MDENMEEWVVVLYQGSETFSTEGAICAHFPTKLKPPMSHKTRLTTYLKVTLQI